MVQETPTLFVDSEALAKAYMGVQAAANKKAENLRILDLRELSGFTDFFLVASGHSDRQVQAIADAIVLELREQGFKPLSVEGYQDGRWVLVDFGDMVCHIFHDALRDYYSIEELWALAKRVPIPTELYVQIPMN